MRVTRIHQIELSSRCNLRCRYCPHHKMRRAKIDMSRAVFELALDWVRYYRKHAWGTQTELSLTGLGEALLHDRVVEYAVLARDALGPGLLLLATNGLALTEEQARAFARIDLKLYVSLHRPELAKPAIDLAAKHGILGAVNSQFATSALDWAGQVDWTPTAQPAECQYLAQGWGVVLANGDITTCCMDAEGDGVVGHVRDEPGSAYLKQFKLCDKCQLIPPAKEKVA